MAPRGSSPLGKDNMANTCQMCKVDRCFAEAKKHPSEQSRWNWEWSKLQLRVKKVRCEKHGN